jgi:HK97 family phage major capsid protein
MPKNIQALREQRSALAQDVKARLDDSKNRSWTNADQEQYDAKIKEIDAIDASLERHQKMMDIAAKEKLDSQIDDAAGRKIKDNGVRAIHAKWMRQGDHALTAEEWRIVRNTMSTGTGSEGGYTVQSEVARQAMDALKSLGGMREVATVIQTESGASLSYPTSDGTAEEGEQIGENTTATAADVTFGTVALDTFKYSSKIVAVPFELLQDSSIDIEAFVNQRLITRIARITNKKFTIGAGTTEPRGAVTASSAGKTGTTGQTATVIFDDLVDLEHSVEIAYRELGRCRFMMHDDSFKVVKKLKDSQGRPIFIPGYDGLAGPVANSILGYPVTPNNHMATMAANAKSILFGDFSNYVIRDVMAVTLFRFTDSAYAKLGQVGFLMWSRHGGNYIDVGASLKHYANSAT